MVRSLLTLLLLFTSRSIIAQDINAVYIPKVDEYVVADKEPIPLNLFLIKDKIGYPSKAVKMRLEGKVFSRVLVNQQGEVAKYVLTRVDHPVLGEAVEKDLESLRFQPAKRNDSIINYWVNIPFKFYLSERQNVKAQKHSYRTLFQTLFTSNAKKAHASLEAGIQMFDKREYRLAGKQFKDCIQRVPKRKSKQSRILLFNAHLNLGHAYAQLKSWEFAKTHYTEAIGISRGLENTSEEIEKLLPSVYLARGYVLLKQKAFVRSLADYNYVSLNFEEALTQQKPSKNAVFYPWRQQISWIEYQKGLLYLQLKKNQEAINHFAQACERDPGSALSAAALSHMGLAKSEMGDFEGAFSDIQTAIDLNEDDPQPYYFKALVLMELESQDIAEELLERAKALFAKLDSPVSIPSMYPANEDE